MSDEAAEYQRWKDEHFEPALKRAESEVRPETPSGLPVAPLYGREGGYPINPNGSTDSVAGLTDTTGRVLGLMPHPERFVRRTQHPRWTRLGDLDSDGMTIFNNAVKHIGKNF